MTNRVAGVDEAGRGPLAGPVVAAAVILPEVWTGPDLVDSKTLSEKKRHACYDAITSQAIAWSIGVASVAEIDEHNILQASMLAMTRAVEKLLPQPDHVLVDGNRLPVLTISAEAIVQGDASHACISAASIVAKVIRDQLIVAMDRHFPEYGFAQHKGYGTAAHMAALQAHGPCRLHRQSFAPVKRARLAFAQRGQPA